LIAIFGPGATSFRPYIHKLRGVKICRNVFIGDEVYLENEYPENIEIHDGAGIALRSTLISHYRGLGKIIIGKNAWIGACCTIAAAPNQVLKIGEGAVLAANSVVTKDLPPFTFVGGVPAKPIAQATVPGTIGYSYEEFKNGLRPLKEKK
jgi:acetyltransferase-like isoleucine patch superfamily enzyme